MASEDALEAEIRQAIRDAEDAVWSRALYFIPQLFKTHVLVEDSEGVSVRVREAQYNGLVKSVGASSLDQLLDIVRARSTVYAAVVATDAGEWVLCIRVSKRA